MDKDVQLQRLLRLKQFERPPQDYADGFLDRFHERQRADLMNGSAFSLLADRAAAWLDGLRRPAVLWGAGLAYAAFMLILWRWPAADPPAGTMIVIQQPQAPGAGGAVTVPVQYTPGAAAPVPAANGAPDQPAPDNIPGRRRTVTQPEAPVRQPPPEVGMPD